MSTFHPSTFRRLATAFALAASICGPTVAHAHDTFLRPHSARVAPGAEVAVAVFHGTFDASDYRIEIDHVASLTRSGPDRREAIPREGWDSSARDRRGLLERFAVWRGAPDLRRTSAFAVVLPVEGTHVLGMSLHPSHSAMSPEVFREYLEEHGLSGEPAVRNHPGALAGIVNERWSKYVKTVVQAGALRTDDVTRPLGHAAEIVPVTHPLEVRAPATLEFRLILGRRPLPDQVVTIGRPRPGFGRESPAPRFLRSDAAGRVAVEFSEPGVWWLGFVYLVRASPADDVDFISHWATLGFEIP